MYMVRSSEKSWPLRCDTTMNCAAKHFGICPSIGQKKPSEKVDPWVKELLIELASQVLRSTKDISSGFVWGWRRDHERDTEVRIPARAPRERRHRTKPSAQYDRADMGCRWERAQGLRGRLSLTRGRLLHSVSGRYFMQCVCFGKSVCLASPPRGEEANRAHNQHHKSLLIYL